MLPFRWSARALACAVLCSSACDGTSSRAPSGYGGPSNGSPDRADTPDDDAGVEESDLQQDASVAAPLPGESPVPPTEACAFVPEGVAIVAETFASPDDPLALSMRNEGAMLSWVAYENGKRKVTPMWFSASTSNEADLTIVDSVQREPASAATRDGFMAVWSDDQAGSFNLYAQRINAQGLAGDVTSPVRLTENDDDDRSPAVVQGADGHLLVAWRAEHGAGQGRTLLLDADGKPQASAQDIPGFSATFGRPALATLGQGYLLAWVDNPSRQVRLQRLDELGAPISAFVRADMDGEAQGNLELTTTPHGGALVFDVLTAEERAEVRFRAFDAAGALLGAERTLTEAAERGLVPSVVGFRGGYAVAYRSLREGKIELRVVLVNAEGEHVSAIDLTHLQALDLPTVLRVAPDGLSMFVAWTDRVEDADSYAVHRAWLRCDDASGREGGGL